MIGVIYVARTIPLIFFLIPGVLYYNYCISCNIFVITHTYNVPIESASSYGLDIASNGGNSAIDVKLICLVSRSYTVHLSFISPNRLLYQILRSYFNVTCHISVLLPTAHWQH